MGTIKITKKAIKAQDKRKKINKKYKVSLKDHLKNKKNEKTNKTKSNS